MNSRVAEAGSPRPSVQFSLMFLLDTNTFIYFFKGQGRVPERMLATPPGEVAISAVSLYEIEVGIAKSVQPAKRRRQFDTFLAVVSLLPFDRPAARARRNGARGTGTAGSTNRPAGQSDFWYGAAHRAALVRRNTREFPPVANLAIMDWYS